MINTNIKVGKTIVDEAISRVLQMRVNRGLGKKVFKKTSLPPITRFYDEGKKISKHRLKAA